ncbi:biotin/lipoyl-containing protein, partial [Phenylobacterium sp.]|uniref:biotin/lipoyl-containing protein n=1 Tax=Phenylobacterium sp. TaxID=1871053 RepID=UPI0037C773CA
MTDILMPALSPTMEEGTLAKWHVKVGDTVSSGDVIAEIETDKATMEVEAVDEGVVEALLVAEGAEGVKVNATIARLAGEAGAAAPSPAPPAAKAPEPAAVPVAATPPPSARPTPPPQAREERGQRIFASPLARRIAGQKGVDLGSVTGSGPYGRIIRADVEAAKPGQAKAAAPSAATAAAPTPAAPRQVQSLEQMG